MKHKMWSRLLSMVLAVMMITSIVPTSAFAEAASEIAASSQAVAEVVEQTEEVTLPEDTTTEEPAAETPAQEPAEDTPAEEPAGEPVPTAEPVAEPTAEPATENEQPTAEPTQAPAETAVPSEQPSAEPTAAPEGTETPEGTAVPSETPVPSESPVPSETPVPTETPEATEEPVVMNEEEYTTSVTTDDGVNVEVTVPAGTLPKDAVLKVDRLAEGSEDYNAAQKTLEENGVEFDGFAALDIRFELNGEEVEPDHPVQVKIIANNVLPEEVDPATVAVQHLKENEDGTVTVENVAVAETVDENTVQADMPAMMAAAPAEEQAGEAQPAEEPGTVTADGSELIAEFTVESFSSFTVTWDEYHSLTVYYVSDETDQNGIYANQIKVDRIEDVTAGNNGEVDLTDYFDNISGYSQKGIYLNYGPAESDNYDNQPQVEYIRYTAEKGWQYKSRNSQQWTDWNLPEDVNERRVFFVYKTRGITAVQVDTEDTAGKIKINLFDYENVGNNDNAVRQAKINKIDSKSLRSLLFFGSSHTGTGPNYYTGGHNVFQGIVQNTLSEGYPVLKKGNWGDPITSIWNPESGESLKYLFNPNATEGENGIEEVVTNANYLFQMDADGYYYYDSAENFAQIDAQTSGFTVYNKPTDNSAKFNPFGTGGINSKFNPHFGMTVETSFVMPKGGKINGQDMVFEFSGDDDVWVFVDNVLVLDMGGIHQDQSGSINFATGNVIVNEENNKVISTSLARCFEKAGGTWNGDTYSTHTLKFFYLERGAGYSNCKLKFNLSVVPQNSLMVTKELDETGNDALDDYLAGLLEYRFRVVDATNTTELRIGSGTKYDIFKGGKDTGRDGKVEADGTFTLKKDETAVFENRFDAKAAPYIVQELVLEDAKGQFQGIKYEVNGTGGSTTTTDKGDIVIGEDNFIGYNSSKIDPATLHNGGIASVTFKNTVTTNKDELSVLQITKTLKDGAQPTDETFVMEVSINGDLLPTYTEYKVTSAQNPTGDYVEVGTEGQIVLKAGQTATLLMLAGNEFSVKELTLDEDYRFSEYKLNGETYEVNQNTPVTGTLKKETQQVTVVNERLKGDVTITKTIVNNANLNETQLETIKNGLTFTLTPATGETKQIHSNQMTWEQKDGKLTGTYTFYNQENGTYTVTESVGGSTPNDVALTVKANGQTATAGLDDTYISESEQLTAPDSIVFAFENTYASATGTLIIQKTVKGLENDPTALEKLQNQLVFTVTKPDASTQEIRFNATGWQETPSGSGVYTYTMANVPVGSYKVEEKDDTYTIENYNWEGNATVGEQTLTNQGTVTFKFTNTYSPAELTLTIKKNLSGFANYGKPVFDFKVTDTGTGDVWYCHIDMTGKTLNEEVLVDELKLPAGHTYQVQELSNQNYSFVKLTQDDVIINPGTGAMTREAEIRNGGKIVLDENTELVFYNDPRKSNIPTDGSATENKVDSAPDSIIIWKNPEEYGNDWENNIKK